MTRAPIVLRLAAVTALFAVVFLAQGSVLNRGEHPAPFASVEANATEEKTVRISAKRLQNGRTEFGLQVRSNGAWGPAERLLPRGRMFPANARVDRWLRSTPLELDSGHVVRITARLLENDRIEFGLHEVIDGELGDRLLPRSRMFPTNPTVDRWLNSSSLVLSVQAQTEELMSDESNETDDPNVADTQEPAWTPITEAQSGTTEAGVSYSIEYPLWLDGVRRTEVLIHASDSTSQTEGQSVQFWVDCRQNRRTYEIGGLPSTPEGEYEVRSRVDDGDWIDEAWNVRVADGGFVFVHPAFDYESLRGGKTLVVEIALDPVFRASYDLTALFGTPVQSNIDNCGGPPSTESYVPIVNVDGQLSTALYYSARHEDGGVTSYVKNTVSVASAFEGRLELTAGCWFSVGRGVSLVSFEYTDRELLDVTLELDGIVLPPEPWRVDDHHGSKVASNVWSPDPTELIERLRHASSLTVTIDGSGLPPVTFDLTGMFDTPVQENIDECGNYKSGETREPPVELNTGGRVEIGDDGYRVSWGRLQGATAIPTTQLNWNGPSEPDTGISFSLGASCGSTGSWMMFFGSRLGELSPGTLEVSWSLDGAPVQRETWRVIDLRGVILVAHPVNAVSVLQAWRNGQTLDLTIHTATPHTERIDLTAFFGTPVQSSLDECLAVPAPDLPTPSGEAPVTFDGSLAYSSGKQYGNHVASTGVSVSSGESAQVPPTFEAVCGIGGVQIRIGNVGRGEILMFTGDTTDVTWLIDGGAPQTATWDIWWNGTNRGDVSVSPPDDAVFYAAIRDARSLSFSVATDPLATAEFDLAGNGFWSTPVQPNLDACPDS